MLISKKEKGDVISVKLITGEEIFGRYVTMTDNMLTMTKVMKLVIAPNGAPGFTSVLQTSEQEELIFDRNHVLLIANTAEQIKTDYLDATSNIKIATPAESAIIHP